MSEGNPIRLILTKADREAFSWIGERYSTGWQVRSALMDYIPLEKEWDDEGDIEFLLDFIGIQIIYELSLQEDHQWPLCCQELKDKMNELIQLPY